MIQRISDKNPEIQELIDRLMIEVCTEKGIASEQVFIIMAILETNRNKSVEDIKNSLWEF